MRWSRGQLVVGRIRRADLVTGELLAQRRWNAVVEEYAQAALRCLGAARGVLEDRVDLRLRDSGEPSQELLDGGPALEVLE